MLREGVKEKFALTDVCEWLSTHATLHDRTRNLGRGANDGRKELAVVLGVEASHLLLEESLVEDSIDLVGLILPGRSTGLERCRAGGTPSLERRRGWERGDGGEEGGEEGERGCWTEHVDIS